MTDQQTLDVGLESDADPDDHAMYVDMSADYKFTCPQCRTLTNDGDRCSNPGCRDQRQSGDLRASLRL